MSIEFQAIKDELLSEKSLIESGIKEVQGEIDFYLSQDRSDLCKIFEKYLAEKEILLVDTNHAIFKLNQATQQISSVLKEVGAHNDKLKNYRTSLSIQEKENENNAQDDGVPNFKSRMY